MTNTFSAIFITSFAFLGTGCGGAADEIERTYDCAKICEKYADCYDDDLDKSECVDSCEDQGEADPDFAEMAGSCEACIDDISCLEATLDCSDDCGTVVSSSAN